MKVNSMHVHYNRTCISKQQNNNESYQGHSAKINMDTCAFIAAHVYLNNNSLKIVFFRESLAEKRILIRQESMVTTCWTGALLFQP